MAVGVVILVILIMAVWPASTDGLESRPDPTASYESAIARFEELTEGESDVVFGPCGSRLLDHGASTEVAVVLYHGLTNCPKQFVEMAEEIHAEGATVVILRAPRHGRANASGDRIGGASNLGPLGSDDLRDFADDSLDIAAGLGDEVRVLGLSMGEVMAVWAGQEREDVSRVVAVAPAISIPGMPGLVTTAAINLFRKLPNISLPGESKLDHAYAGESTKGLVAMFVLGRATQSSTARRGPAADQVVIVINPDDDQVDRGDVEDFAQTWSERDGRVQVEYLPATGLPHDAIDVSQPDGDPELVYPILLDFSHAASSSMTLSASLHAINVDRLLLPRRSADELQISHLYRPGSCSIERDRDRCDRAEVDARKSAERNADGAWNGPADLAWSSSPSRQHRGRGPHGPLPLKPVSLSGADSRD